MLLLMTFRKNGIHCKIAGKYVGAVYFIGLFLQHIEFILSSIEAGGWAEKQRTSLNIREMNQAVGKVYKASAVEGEFLAVLGKILKTGIFTRLGRRSLDLAGLKPLKMLLY